MYIELENSLKNIFDLKLLKYCRERVIARNIELPELLTLFDNYKDESTFLVTFSSSYTNFNKFLKFIAPYKFDKEKHFKKMQSKVEGRDCGSIYKIAHKLGDKQVVSVPKQSFEHTKVIHFQRNESMPKAA